MKTLVSLIALSTASLASAEGYFHALPPTDTLPRPAAPTEAFCAPAMDPAPANVAFTTEKLANVEVMIEDGSLTLINGGTIALTEGRMLVQAAKTTTVEVGGYKFLVKGNAALYAAAQGGKMVVANVLDFWNGDIKMSDAQTTTTLEAGSALFVAPGEASVERISLYRLVARDALVRSIYRNGANKALLDDMQKIAVAQCTLR